MIFYFLADRKILVFFQISKNHSSVNFCRRQKIYLKYRYEISFFIEKNKKKVDTNSRGGGGVCGSCSTILPVFVDICSRFARIIRANREQISTKTGKVKINLLHSVV